MNDEHIQTEEPGSRAEVPRRFRILVFTMSLAMAAAGIGMLVARSTQPIRTATLYCSAPPVKAGQTASGETLAQIAAAVSPSIVSITAKGTTTTLKGSGIVIRSDGMVLTNNHIVADVGVNGGEIIVDFADGHIAPATIVGRSPEDDVAVIQVQHSEGLRAATLGSSAGLRVGEQVLAIGNALGYPGTVTAGIVSALGRELCLTGDTTPSVENKQLYGTQPWLPAEVTLKNLIQTDAPINQGTSGDALVDIKGRVVGMCTAFDAPAGSGNIGVGFAIPIESAYDIAPRSSEVPGSAERSVLGKGRRLFPNDVFAALGLTDSVVTTKGVIIATYRPAWTGGRPDMRWGSFGPNLCEDHDSTVCSWIRERMTRSTAPRG
ncbi:MAG: S1C family serine protease [Actinomycetota bacterium]